MSVLKNTRYRDFEHSTPRDAFRGLALQQFPWLLETTTHISGPKGPQWHITVLCLNAVPSGFGSKLNLTLQAVARLTPDASRDFAFAEAGNPSRLETLFGQSTLLLEDTLEKTVEGVLENINQYGTSVRKALCSQLDQTWTVERIQKYFRTHLKDRSPGGFGKQTEH